MGRPTKAVSRRMRYGMGLQCPVPDLDLMDSVALHAFLADCRKTGITETARRIFPSKPKYYMRTALAFYRMAHFRIKILRGDKNALAVYERNYRELPAWAKWRDRFPVQACVPDGDKFLRKPIKRNPLDLLKGESDA